MKYLFVVLVCIVALTGLAGCQQPSASFVSAVDGHTAVILPEYKAYVAADAKLTDTDKDIRTKSADALVELIETAKKGSK